MVLCLLSCSLAFSNTRQSHSFLPCQEKMEGAGSVTHWGFSRAIDFQDLDHIDGDQNIYNIKDSKASILELDSTIPPLDILLLGAGDPRHIITTISRAWRTQRNRKINFYVIEGQATILARIMLLLSIFLDKDCELSNQERVHMWLELYGNSLLREKTVQYLSKHIDELIRTVTDESGPLSSTLDLSALKHREKDDLEFTYKFWKSEKKPFDIEKLRDYRLRRLYTTRYDSRENLIDWDYHMKLKEKFSTLTKQEYLRWRQCGLAFEVRDSVYVKPNRTLASVDGLKQDGLTVTKWGYFSDIVTGPFLAFGSDSEDKDMLKKKNDMAVYTTQEICMHNLSSLLYEYQHHGTYRPNDPSWVPTTSLISSSSSSTDPPRRTTDFFKIHFLPCDPHITINTRKDRYNGKFDIVFIGSGFGHRVHDVERLLKDQSGEDEKSTAIVETAKYEFP
ncbi:hypothetical protein BKA69DRAFT_1103220 [Paraphysoderma sedebokerense]|nr:hypothetical protein BKA69DRAFT_1103220 [Paraphysoderma sedebokerense]